MVVLLVLGIVLVLLFVAVVILPMLPILLTLALLSPAAVLPPGVVPVEAVAPPQGPMPSGDASSMLMQTIQPWYGTPYVFGGNTRAGVDCSGFVLATARSVFGVNLPRTAQGQYDATERVTEPRAGDLVFFTRTYQSPDWITHVGWYIGSGWMVSAIEPTLGRQSLSTPYWSSHLVGYGRLRT